MCKTRPVQSDGSKTYAFCGKACAAKACKVRDHFPAYPFHLCDDVSDDSVVLQGEAEAFRFKVWGHARLLWEELCQERSTGERQYSWDDVRTFCLVAWTTRKFTVADVFSSPGIAELAVGDPRYRSGEKPSRHVLSVITHASSSHLQLPISSKSPGDIIPHAHQYRRSIR